MSVTDVLTPAQVKQRLEEEKRRQQAWDAAHPEEGLKESMIKRKLSWMLKIKILRP
ncbi:hypothetical protein [Klebsiella pneumoniae]|nr:hypothetical protein [Klebsiella pneumoniae]